MRTRAARRLPVAGDVVDPITLYLSLQRLIMVSGANRDFALTHVDNEAARQGGAESAYADVMFVFAMVERLLLEWAGPGSLLRGIGPMRLRDFVLSGYDLSVQGTVVAVRPQVVDSRQGHDIEIEVTFVQPGDRHPVTGSGLVWLPR